MKKLYILSLFIVSSVLLFADNEFYINGAIVKINGRVNTTIPTLHVNGNIINNNGTFDNAAGLIEIKGNWTNTPSSNNYTSTGIERFNGTVDQQINGTWNGTSGNNNQFYDLEIVKTSTSGQYVSLNTNVNVNSAGSVSFTGSNGIIRTDASSHGDDGSAYQRELFLQNTTPSKFSGYNTGNGATTKYVEGKLRRNVNTGTYYFPIGVAPSSLDGMEAFELNLNSAPSSQNIIGYIKPGATAPIHRNIFCDIGTDPNGTVSNPFTDCAGGPDGILDWFYLESGQDLSHEWVVTPSTSSGFNYDITLHPGTNLGKLSTYYTVPGACNTPYSGMKLRIVAKNGKPGGDGVSGPFSPFPFAHLTGYGVCGAGNYSSSLNIGLSGQTSFSTFRIHGTNANSQTALPIELVSLDAKAINNEFIKVSWVTASETNNAGFELQRSTDGLSFEPITFVNGAGNSVEELSYDYDDHAVQHNILYYYKLKQVDFDGQFKFSNIVKASIKPFTSFTISEVYPNPSQVEAYLDIYSPNAMSVKYDIINPLGQKLYNASSELKDGNNKLKIPTKELSSGNYYLILKTDSVHILRN